MTLGVIGGGQLGRMLALAAAPLDIDVVVLDPTPDCPAGVAARQILGSLQDAAALRELASAVDVLTFEIEHCNLDALEEIAAEGKPIRPDPAVLRIVSDKLVQRRALARAGLPGPDFTVPVASADAVASPAEPAAAELSLKDFLDRHGKRGAVRKARFGGYDGRGVELLDAAALTLERRNAATTVSNAAVPNAAVPEGGEAPSYLEERVPVTTEVSVIVARDIHGATSVYDPVEMIMNPKLNLVDRVVAPARIDHDLALRCEEVARDAADALGVVGLLAVELFISADGRVLINEVAPRPHNSGHHTIEGCATSQFEQHLRAVTGLPLGSARLIRPTVMQNIVAPDRFGTDRSRDGAIRRFPERESIAKALAIDEIHLHLYGKHEARPGRKMGHLTAGGSSVDEALARVRDASNRLGLSVEE